MLIGFLGKRAFRLGGCLMIFGLTLGSAAVAQNREQPASPPPLSRAEVEKFARMSEDMLAAGPDQAKMDQIMAAAGWEEARLNYVGDRLLKSFKIIKDGENSLAGLPATQRPTAAEIALVRKYERRFDKIAASADKKLKRPGPPGGAAP